MGVHILIRTVDGEPLRDEVDYSFEQTRIVIGRGASADIRIPHLTISESHATLHHQGDAYSIVDSHSTNGTSVNGVRLVPGRGRRLKDGDLIDIGVYQLVFHCGIALTSQTTTERTAELARRLFRQSGNGVRVGTPRLVVLSGSDTGRSLEIPAPPARLMIGRAGTCQLVLADPRVSREHAELFRDLDGVMIHNLSAKNGLDVNQQPTGERRLRDGDELVIGSTRLLFEDPAAEPLEALMGESDQRMTAPMSVPTETHREALPSAPRASEAPVQRSSVRLRAADLVIYALASLVIILSIVGLIALL